MSIHTCIYHSPCGELLLGSYEGKLCLCDWLQEKRRTAIDRRLQRHLGSEYEERTDDTLELAIRQLDEYFARKRNTFSVPLLSVGTEFQKQVWQVLQKIPYGETWTYRKETEVYGNPKAVRAVAQANKANSISIFVPCHRVIGSNGTLTGYGGGLEAKWYLLELETGNLFL
ncbi:MAG: methylated-DNA--[Bacteroides sp.]|nr:methylated-DNA--[protein]-cysteine S-methyltransferase [Bacteroides sp.]